MMPERRLLLAAVCAAALALAAACASSAKVQQAKQEKDPQYQYEKAVICMNAGLTDAAIPYLNQALALDPRHHPSLNLLGLARLIKGDLPAAIAALEKCVEVAPAFSDAHNNLATALQESGQTERAEAAYRKAFALDENYNASFNLAKIEFQRNSLEPALSFVRQSLRKNSKSLLALNLQGLILESMNRLDEAEDSYAAALALVPGEPNVEFNLAMVRIKREDVDGARGLLTAIRRKLDDRKTPQAGDAELRRRVDEALRRLQGR
jgi:Flp pilus assembly protein TadD